MNDSHYNLDERLIEAYKATDYLVERLDLCINIGVQNENLEEFLIDNQAYAYAIITAYNPYSKILTERENQENQTKLQTKLDEGGYLYLRAKGKPTLSDWLPEPSFFIVDIKKFEVLALATSFRQNAIVYGTINSVPQLISQHS